MQVEIARRLVPREARRRDGRYLEIDASHVCLPYARVPNPAASPIASAILPIPRMMSHLARGAAALVWLGCGTVLLGYALHIGFLVDLRPGLSGMSPLTALALLLLAMSILADGGGARRQARVMGGVALGIGLVALATISLLGRDVVGPHVAASVFLFNAARAGATSGATAIGIVALGLAAVTRDRSRLADQAGAVALVISGFALLGYAYGVRDLYSVPLFDTMALHTALGLFVLALASLALRPDVGWAAIVASSGRGGVTTRRMLAFTPLPPVAGWALLLITDAHRLGPSAAMACLVVLTIVPLSLLILRDGRVMNALDEERRTKGELRRANEREIRLVTNALPVLIAFIDRTYTYRFANQAYEDWFYLPPEQVIGRKVYDLLDAEGFANRRSHFERALSGEESRFELVWPHRDGRPRDADIRYMPRTAFDGTIDGFYVFVVDVTDRKRIERMLLATNEMLEQSVAARTKERDQIWTMSRDMLCVASFEGYLVSVNPAWTATLGWTVEELTAEPFLTFVHPDDVAATIAAADGMSAGTTLQNFEHRYRCVNGDYRWLSWNAVPRDGMIYCSVRDVTEAKAVAAHQAALEDQLRQSQKMEAVGQLTGGIAHDFNNLLTGITGSLDMLALRLKQGRSDGLDRYIDGAQGAAKRAAALTHRLLAFSRRQTLAPKPTDANRLVTEMEDLCRRTVGPAIAIEIKGAADLWTILVDPNQLENALLNLCINARDAMPDGGRITIETANHRLDEGAARRRDLPPGQYVSLCVNDTGTGMAPDVVERVFDPFFTTKPLGQGTGLGLSMIYGFVRQSGGQVRVDSEVGRGTRIALYLPRHHGAVVVDDPRAAVSVARSEDRGETVLIVDDEPTLRMLISEVVEDLGCRAIEAADGAAGLGVLRSDTPIHLLVTDIGLPGGIDGRQVADAGRVLRPNLKVIFITGFAENAVFGDGQIDDWMRVLPKPFTMESLNLTIKTMVKPTA